MHIHKPMILKNFQTFFVPPDSTDYCSVGRQCSLLQCNYPLLYEGRTADSIVEMVKLISTRSGVFFLNIIGLPVCDLIRSFT